MIARTVRRVGSILLLGRTAFEPRVFKTSKKQGSQAKVVQTLIWRVSDGEFVTARIPNRQDRTREQELKPLLLVLLADGANRRELHRGRAL
jgi:hypothetical protein